jgi:hypothetical protein
MFLLQTFLSQNKKSYFVQFLSYNVFQRIFSLGFSAENDIFFTSAVIFSFNISNADTKDWNCLREDDKNLVTYFEKRSDSDDAEFKGKKFKYVSNRGELNSVDVSQGPILQNCNSAENLSDNFSSFNLCKKFPCQTTDLNPSEYCM